MSEYDKFAEVYDIFMSDFPYDEWAEHIEKIWKKYSLEPKLIAELACGTGSISQRLFEKGYDIIGIDKSEQMLSKAKQKNPDIFYVCQDMRKFELFGTVDSIICICDSINYILDENELIEMFRLVNNYLNPKGLFIFDINTIHKFRDVLSDNDFCGAFDDCAFIWENFYYEDEGINEYLVNFFIRESGNGMYSRYEEYHQQKAYSLEKMTDIIKKSGMKFLGAYNELSFDSPDESSQRIYFIAQENGKEI